ncbi:MAG: WbuC family cupin fold metalloprotein [Proteobacteria bacterium]|nr:WbuC family cupin fold metalloprotein [Pseudomonadota bacterium]HQR04172.1 WbuC family cupin fold metalloprotein [Rhodocyclaceae bacterium]
MIRLIDTGLLDTVSQAAAASPRRRRNHNFHADDSYPAHRLLNALEPGTYIAPHRHLDAGKDETLILLRGRIGLVIFDEQGAVTTTALLEDGGASRGVDIPHGTWHTLVTLASGSVFFEAKAGPYTALAPAERAPWAPVEGDAAAVTYLAALLKRFY